MIKLATPVQYEDTLDALNAVRPLALAAEYKTELIYPVFCVNSVNKGRPAVGKLARCIRPGSLLKNNFKAYDNYEALEIPFHPGMPDKSFIFAQPVFQVYIVVLSYEGTPDIWWCDSSFSIMFKPIYYNQDIMLPFVGQRLYIHGVFEATEWVVLKAHGFY